jgi:ATP-dependent helicase/nuclease subunit A
MNIRSEYREYALNYNHSSWITANAGSGKTYILARRVVRLLVDGARPEHILCLTYTNAAAAEMRSRILALLAQLWSAEGAARAQALAEMLGEVPDAAQLARAVQLYPLVLDSPAGGICITTLHGFCQQLLRSFPIEAGLSPHVRLIEDYEANQLKSRTIRRLYGADGAKFPQLVAALMAVTERLTEARLEDLCYHILSQPRRFLPLLEYDHEAALREAAFRGVPDSLRTLEGIDRALVLELPPDHEAALRDVTEFLCREGSSRFRARAEEWAHWLALPQQERVAGAEHYRAIWLTAKREPLAHLLPVRPYGPQHPLTLTLQREQARVLANDQLRANYFCREESFHIAVIACGLLELYGSAKENLGLVEYEDIIRKVEALVRDPVLLPWVLGRLDYRIDHLLLDEAQDTSSAQWNIVSALIGELMLVPTPEGIARSLMVVGDVKQSIYSFQGAAPAEFTRVRGEMMAALHGAPAPLAVQTLSTSYRSTAPILALADRLCVHQAIGEEGVTHRLNRAGEAGCVELWPLVVAPEMEEVEEHNLYHIPETYVDGMRAQEMLAEKIATTIRGWLDNGRMLPARGRPVTPADILILVKQRQPMMPLLIRALEAQNIPVAGLDRLALSTHLAVRDLMALMRVFTSPEDDLALAQVLRSPLGNLTEEALAVLAHGRVAGELLWHRLTSHPFAATLARWRRMAEESSPYAFLCWLLESEGMRRAFARRFSHEVHEVLDALLDHASAAGEGVSLFAYEQMLAYEAKEITRESGGDSAGKMLRILTIHGAKGLEAPIVFLAETTRVPTTQKEFSFESAEAAVPLVALSEEAGRAPLLTAAKAVRKDAMLREYQRLLYVAVTRACDALYITGTGSGKTLHPQCWYALLQEAMAGLEDCVEEDGTLKLTVPQTRPVAAEIPAMPALPPLPEWTNAPAPAEVAPSILSPSRLMAQELTLYQQRETGAQRRGVILHRWLEFAPGIDSAIARRALLERLAPDWDAPTLADTFAQMERLLADPDLGWIWRMQGYSEVSITGTIRIAGVQERFCGQIDRLVMQGNQIVILDYKTAAHPPKPEEIPASYLWQMKAYQQLLIRRYPDKTIRSALLWTSLPRLDWLEDQLAGLDISLAREAS